MILFSLHQIGTDYSKLTAIDKKRDKRNSLSVISLDFDDGLDMQLLILFFVLLNNNLFTVYGKNERICSF